MENAVTENQVITTQKETYTTKQSVIRCVISFICRYIIPVVSYAIPILLSEKLPDDTIDLSYGAVFLMAAPYLTIAGYVFSWVIMYKVRNHNRGNSFGNAMKHIIRWRWVGDALVVLAIVVYLFYCLCSFIEKARLA